MAVSNLNLEVNQGEILGLIGPNGAGKSTTFDLITGVIKPSGGEIFYREKNITGYKPHVIASMGIIRTFQLTSTFRTMSVIDNLRTAFHLQRQTKSWQEIFGTGSYRRARKAEEIRIVELLDFVGLGNLSLNESAAILPYGFQRLLGVAMALAGHPCLLLLDEPLAGMNDKESRQLTEVIRKIRDDRNSTILLVEHNVQAVMEICDRIVVLNFGEEIARGTSDEILRNEKVIEAYLGVEE